jgi:DNA helicase-2/ATP-dependent DNA helicase PcrA
MPRYEEQLASSQIKYKYSSILGAISLAEAKGISPDTYLDSEVTQSHSISFRDPTLLARIYGDYQSTLRYYNAVDYDDILFFGAQLFEENKLATQWCQHVLVDEL